MQEDELQADNKCFHDSPFHEVPSLLPLLAHLQTSNDLLKSWPSSSGGMPACCCQLRVAWGGPNWKAGPQPTQDHLLHHLHQVPRSNPTHTKLLAEAAGCPQLWEGTYQTAASLIRTVDTLLKPLYPLQLSHGASLPSLPLPRQHSS
jgi:hypothetical protein